MPKRDEFPDPTKAEFFDSDPVETKFKEPSGGIDLSEDFFDHKHERCPAEDPRAAIWQEHSFYHNNDWDPGIWTQDQILELARFKVPPGSQGRVSILETALLGADVAGGTAYANNAWQYPSYYNNLLTTGWPNDRSTMVRFYLRLESWQKHDLPGAARMYASRANLPGVAYPPLGQWEDTRYDFSRGSPHGPSMLVPEGHFLTLWIEIVNRDLERLKRVWGRLGGVVQSYRDNPQGINAARAWHDR